MKDNEEVNVDSAYQEQESDNPTQVQEDAVQNDSAMKGVGEEITLQAATPAGAKRNTGAIIQQIGVNMLMLGLLAFLAFLTWQRFTGQGQVLALASSPEIPAEAGSGGPVSFAESGTADIALDPYATPAAPYLTGVYRQTNVRTIIPTRPRVDVITYTVATGDTLFSIANNFGLKPETVLWGNFDVLEDNPHLLKPDQVLISCRLTAPIINGTKAIT